MAYYIVPYLYFAISQLANRFTEKDAIPIAKALSRNRILQELYIGNNPLKAQGALLLVRAITPQLSPNSVLEILDLENVWANKNILQELETLETFKPWVAIKLDGILSNYVLVGPNVKRILFERAKYEAMAPKRKKERHNFDFFVTSLNDKTIRREKFIELVKRFGLKLSNSLINEIMNVFEGPQNTVDQELFKSSYLKEYPETKTIVLPPAKLRKKAKKIK